MSAVTLDQVRLAIGGRSILADITLDIGEGEFIGVLGANGAGKTTLMRAILGLVPLAKGEIRVAGRPARRGNPAIGYLPQTRSAASDLRIRGRDLLASTLHGHRWGVPMTNAADRREIDRCLDLVGARGLAERAFSAMSGGERQRLLIAGALIGAPKLLLLDEPLISLDPHQQKLVVDLVRDLSHRLKLTVLFSAHELNQLLGVIDRVLYLGNDQAVLGTVDEVITPATLSRLYGAPIDVVRANGHIFVMSGGQVIERDQHAGHGH